jgi:predicted HAD superfamily phosphohydrolase YqeG
VRLGRVPIRDVQSLDDVEIFVESTDDEKVILFDVDNTLAPQNVELAEFGHLVNSAIDRFAASPCITRVIVLTNGPQRGVPRMISRGNKPWTTRRRLGLRDNHAPVVVVGDQVLTDGFLAWRLRATFLHLVIDDETEDRRQTVMRRLGGIVAIVLFREPA